MEREITAIKAQKRNRQRVSIFLDGEFAFGLSRFVAAWLEPGRKLSQADIDRLQQEDTYEIAFQKALQFIQHRPRSIEETRRRLDKKGFAEEVVQSTLERLQEKHYLDDSEFARLWIENRNEFRPRSDRLLSYELRLKGVADDVIAQALEKHGGDQNELAYQAGIKKAKQCRNEDRSGFFKKVGGFLGRRGFHYGIVKPTVNRLWEDFALPYQESLDDTEKME
ncbi:recombination regulator RecX [bacterium]|nr:recombination regulator RecX [bacterium]